MGSIQDIPTWVEGDVKLPTAPKQITLVMRREEALRLRVEENLTFREISERIREQRHKFLAEDQVYNEGSAYKDVRAALELVAGDVRELAKRYLPGELAKLEKTEARLQVLEDELFDMVERTILEGKYTDFQELERAVNSLTKIVDRRAALMDRRARYMPLEVPKQMRIQSENMSYTLDDFLKAKENARAIEGQFYVRENGDKASLPAEIPDQDS